MADKHLNLFYTYNRDSELIENNLTRAFIVFLSVVSGETRHNILSKLLKKAHKNIQDTVSSENLNFREACFALQSNIDQHIPKNLERKLLLTIATELFDTSSSVDMIEIDATETSNEIYFSSVPDAWIYDNIQDYCILVEVKVGSYPLNTNQLQSHARDWFGSSQASLDILKIMLLK